MRSVGPSCGVRGGEAQHEAISVYNMIKKMGGHDPLHHTLATQIILTDDSPSLLEWAVEHVCPRQEVCLQGPVWLRMPTSNLPAAVEAFGNIMHFINHSQ